MLAGKGSLRPNLLAVCSNMSKIQSPMLRIFQNIEVLGRFGVVVGSIRNSIKRKKMQYIGFTEREKVFFLGQENNAISVAYIMLMNGEVSFLLYHKELE